MVYIKMWNDKFQVQIDCALNKKDFIDHFEVFFNKKCYNNILFKGMENKDMSPYDIVSHTCRKVVSIFFFKEEMIVSLRYTLYANLRNKYCNIFYEQLPIIPIKGPKESSAIYNKR